MKKLSVLRLNCFLQNNQVYFTCLLQIRLLSPWIAMNRSCDLSLYLHMWDGMSTAWNVTAMGTFKIDIRTAGAPWVQMLWVKGNQGNNWTQHRIDISVSMNIFSSKKTWTPVGTSG